MVITHLGLAGGASYKHIQLTEAFLKWEPSEVRSGHFDPLLVTCRPVPPGSWSDVRRLNRHPTPGLTGPGCGGWVDTLTERKKISVSLRADELSPSWRGWTAIHHATQSEWNIILKPLRDYTYFLPFLEFTDCYWAYTTYCTWFQTKTNNAIQVRLRKMVLMHLPYVCQQTIGRANTNTAHQ